MARRGGPQSWPFLQLPGLAASGCRSVVAENRSGRPESVMRYAGRAVPSTFPDQAPTLDAVLACLNALPARATYRTVAELLGVNPTCPRSAHDSRRRAGWEGQAQRTPISSPTTVIAVERRRGPQERGLTRSEGPYKPPEVVTG